MLDGLRQGLVRLVKVSLHAGRRQRRRRGRPGSWRLQDAKAKFSELVRRAKSEGPQHVTVHGREEVVVIGADEFPRLTGDRRGQALIDAMQASPHRNANLAVTRTRLPVRDITS
jgi:prevent-host-death family protein